MAGMEITTLWPLDGIWHPYLGLGYLHSVSKGRDDHADLTHGYYLSQNMIYVPVGCDVDLFKQFSYVIQLNLEYDYIAARNQRGLSTTYEPEHYTYRGQDQGMKLGLHGEMLLNQTNKIEVMPYYYYHHYANQHNTTVNQAEFGISTRFTLK